MSFLGVLLCTDTKVKAQIGFGTNNPKAALEVASATQGVLIPRMTAAEAENIASPKLGEMIYATTNNGTVINKEGFWYFNDTAWVPFGTASQLNLNIYNSDGTLTANRTMNMNGYNLSFDADKLTINSSTQRVGLGNSSPQHTLDVNGNARVRNLSNGSVVASADGTLAIGPKVPYGTVKESLRSADHNGWYKMDGRAVTSLPAIAQTNATALGISGNLINTNNLMMKQGAALASGGTSSLSLLRANLPNYTMTGTTSASADHTHSATASGFNVIPSASGNAYFVRSGRGTATGTAAVNLPSGGAHAHTGNITSGGTGAAISIIPESITYTYFIYLGQ